MTEPWELVIREAVRETIARYNHAGDRGRVDELVYQFTPDGILEIHGGARMHGRIAIAEGLSASARRRTKRAPSEPAPLIRHHVSSTLLYDITPERAGADSYFAVLTRDGLDHWGRYRDTLVPCDGRWLLAHRLVRVDAHRPGSLFPGPPQPQAAQSSIPLEPVDKATVTVFSVGGGDRLVADVCWSPGEM
jgi:hypothetical protein